MIRLKQGTISSERDCWTLTMQIPIDKSNKTEKQLEKIKNDFSTHQTFYGSLQQAVENYCDSALKPVEPEVLSLLQALKELKNEIRSMDLSEYKKRQDAE